MRWTFVVVVVATLFVTMVVERMNISMASQSSFAMKVKRKTSTTKPPAATESPGFTFLVGLEGTGHHLMAKILKRSPALKRIEELGLMNDLTELDSLLFSKPQRNSGLLNPHFRTERFDVTTTQNEVVHLMRKISNELGNETFAIPVNANGHGLMVSYPTGISMATSHKRLENYPHLNLFYETCELAGVSCSHLYLYRDPHSVVKSTTFSRKFNSNVKMATDLYIAMLDVIFDQFSSPLSRTIGCIGLYDDNNTDTWGIIRDAFGWGNQHDVFDATVHELYKPPTVMTPETRQELFPPQFNRDMRSFIEAHERTLEFCREQQMVK